MLIDGDHLYVADRVYGTVGEYSTAGEVINPRLITGLGTPTALGLVPEPSVLSLILFAAAAGLCRRSVPAASASLTSL
jgi:hypothetical protein